MKNYDIIRQNLNKDPLFQSDENLIKSQDY